MIKSLKDLVDECNENIRDRQRILDEAQSIHEQDDISPLVLRRASELSAGSSTVKIETSQFDPLFTTELGKYSDLLSQVKKHSQNQWILLNKIKDANNEFVSKRRGNMEVSRREKALQNLEQAYLKFKEIRTNLVEGIKVRNDDNFIYNVAKKHFYLHSSHNSFTHSLAKLLLNIGIFA